MRLAVFLRGHSLLLVERLGKVETVIKADGVGDCCDGQQRMLQQITGLLDAKIRQVLFRGYAKHRLKRAEQVTAAEPDIGSDILHRDRVGVVRADVLDAFLYIGVGTV